MWIVVVTYSEGEPSKIARGPFESKEKAEKWALTFITFDTDMEVVPLAENADF